MYSDLRKFASENVFVFPEPNLLALNRFTLDGEILERLVVKLLGFQPY